jgi:hypothetical protein
LAPDWPAHFQQSNMCGWCTQSQTEPEIRTAFQESTLGYWNT